MLAEVAQTALELERARREAALRQEADRLALDGSAAELKQVKATLEQEFGAHERDVKALSTQVGELERQREAALRDVAELKTQLKMLEACSFQL